MMLNASMTATYAVARTFKATTPISGNGRQFEQDEIITYEVGQTNATVTFGFEGAFHVVDRSTFKSCYVFQGRQRRLECVSATEPSSFALTAVRQRGREAGRPNQDLPFLNQESQSRLE